MKERERRDRILDVAIDLAEEGGFENVRQRDVAARAGVALGTLYKAFRSKEDILSAALERDAADLDGRLGKKPVPGGDRGERLCGFFDMMTRRMCSRPNYTRAVLRAVASGEPSVAGNVVAYYGRMTGMVIGAMRGTGSLATDPPVSEEEVGLAMMLQQLWFAALVGWSAGLQGQKGVRDQMHAAIDIILRGVSARQEAGGDSAAG
jgi:AcrR family transcriptional regulator